MAPSLEDEDEVSYANADSATLTNSSSSPVSSSSSSSHSDMAVELVKRPSGQNKPKLRLGPCTSESSNLSVLAKPFEVF